MNGKKRLWKQACSWGSCRGGSIFHSLLQLTSRKGRRPRKSNTGESNGKGQAIPTNEMEAGFSYGSIAAECHGLLDHACNIIWV